MTLTHAYRFALSSACLTGSLLFCAPAFSTSTPPSDPPTLTVYTYDAFTTEWGPGPLLEKGFEAQCQCDLQFVALENSAALINRLRLEGPNSQADIVLGLDNSQQHLAEQSGLFQAHGVDSSRLDLPTEFSHDQLLPFDYGYFAFIYNKTLLPEPPESFEALINADDSQKIIIMDPRTSTPGQGLLLWVKALYGDKAPEVWKALQPKILTVTKGWSDAYFNLFLNGEAPMVLSYSTSPAYHMAVDNEYNYQAAAFDEGHYLQIEFAAITRNTSQPELAKALMQYLVSVNFQQHIPLTQVMYPVVDLGDKQPEVFEQLIQPTQVLQIPADELAKQRKAWTREWLEAMSESS